MTLRRQSITLEQCLLYISVIFLLMAQYVVNSHPWDHIFRLMALVALTGVIATFAADRFSRSRRKA